MHQAGVLVEVNAVLFDSVAPKLPGVEESFQVGDLEHARIPHGRADGAERRCLIAAGEPFVIDWCSIDGGGKISSTGGGFQLTGGFWFEQPPGDCNATGIADLLDHADFADCLSGPGGGLPLPDCNCFDFDGDGDADLLDFATLQAAIAGF